MLRLLMPLLLVGVSLPVALWGEEDRDAITRALLAKAGPIARDVGPGIACIYVSRSDAYTQAALWGEARTPTFPGDLGRFDAEAARKRVPANARTRIRTLRSIDDHDLSRANAVPESFGSGIVVDKTGLVLTNAHVVRNATKLYVKMPGKRASWANIHACDPRSDLAVLKLLDPPADLVAPPLGDGGSVTRGQAVFCLANEFAPGFRRDDSPTLSSGIVSNLRQRIRDKLSEWELSKKTLHHYGTLIQTDAKITPGCSGGALVDHNGKIIALTTALSVVGSDKPGGFAIPLDANTKRIIEVLKRGEEVEYGFLGVVLRERQGGGVRLSAVSAGSPAARAGLQAGDRIVKINDNLVTENDDLFLFIGMALAGGTARVEVERQGRLYSYTVRLAKFYVPGSVIAANRPEAKFGLRVDHTSILVQRNPFAALGQPPADGVAIREVLPDSPADKAKLLPDKIITRVNGKAVTSPAEYYAEIARTDDSVELTYLRSDGRPERVTLKTK